MAAGSGASRKAAGERWRRLQRRRCVPPSLGVSFKPAPQDDAASGARSPEAGRAARAAPEGRGGGGRGKRERGWCARAQRGRLTTARRGNGCGGFSGGGAWRPVGGGRLPPPPPLRPEKRNCSGRGVSAHQRWFVGSDGGGGTRKRD